MGWTSLPITRKVIVGYSASYERKVFKLQITQNNRGINIPVRKVTSGPAKGKYKWGKSPKKGTTKKHAAEIGRAAYANGYKG